MPTAYVRRGTAVSLAQRSRANAVPIFVDAADDSLKIGTGSSGAAVRNVATPPLVTIAGDGAIAIADSTVALTKGSPAAITLAAPTAAQAGTRITITSGSAFAHVLTATTLLHDGVTGGAKTLATFAAFVGASITLVAYGLKWHVASLNAVVVS